MPCKTIDLGNGDFAITCSRDRRSRAVCDVCKDREHTLLCDFPLSGAKAGKTCSRKLCGRCAVKVGALDLCPAHAKQPLPQLELPTVR
jgi:hypothetical protein